MCDVALFEYSVTCLYKEWLLIHGEEQKKQEGTGETGDESEAQGDTLVARTCCTSGICMTRSTQIKKCENVAPCAIYLYSVSPQLASTERKVLVYRD